MDSSIAHKRKLREEKSKNDKKNASTPEGMLAEAPRDRRKSIFIITKYLRRARENNYKTKMSVKQETTP
jgi:hypothetical protein